ncbi:MAG: ABC transporter ATP-binding protein [Gammaproteobacteria bacterium]|nr:ABC transporter ATP-binding protein [Gammaproteobacteria bacterium]NNJ91833.1 ABC transporter ATP-binding protein [Gammaproteobacteria bacterium]
MSTRALSIENLCKTYAGGHVALDNISLEVEQGDFFALLGPNGAGKSTAIGIISSLVNKSAGSVRVMGHDLDADPVSVKEQIGLVPQEFNFNQFEPVGEIVINQAGFYGIPRREAMQRAKKYLTQLDLWGKRDVESRSLSGGMKRRLMIARALVHEPRLLILDEPTAGVDIEIRRSMWEFLRGINAEGTTIILTTHYLEEAESLCRNIAIINCGKIVEKSGMSSLLQRLHAQSFVLTSHHPIAVTDALADYYPKLLDDTTLEVCLQQDRGMNQMFADLSDAGIEISGLRNKQNRLEQLFIEMVSRDR